MTRKPCIAIDPEFLTLCPPLREDERQQLQENILADGCRDPLVVWEEKGFILDGHHRFDICKKHDIPFEVHALSLPNREAAINWIINNQLGRRNLTEEQKSYLRGKRYNQEKKAVPNPEGTNQHCEVIPHNEGQPTAERLAAEYHVAPATIERDGQFAAAVDALEEQGCPDIRDTVLHRQSTGDAKVTKKQVTQAGKLVQKREVTPLPFMRRNGWKSHEVVRALAMLHTFPQTEHLALTTLLEQRFIPADVGLQILQNLERQTPEERQRLYTLAQSEDPLERSLAQTLAAQTSPKRDPQSVMANNLIQDLEACRHRLTCWRGPCPNEPWTPELAAIDADLTAIQDRVQTIAAHIDARHQERMAPYADVFP